MAKKAAKKRTPAPPDPQNQTNAPRVRKSKAQSAAHLTDAGKAVSETAADPFVPNEFGAIPPQTGQSSFTSKAPEHQPTPNKTPAPLQTDREPTEPAARTTPADSGKAADATLTPPAGQDTEEQPPGDNRLSSMAAGLDARPPGRPLAHARIGETRGMCWERLRKEARAAGLPKGQGPGTAYEWATQEADRLFPPPVPAVEEQPPAEAPVDPPEPAAIAVVSAPPKDDQGVSGLGDLPPSWPELPANAQLQVEIAWVTANRLRVRDGSGVNLAKALSPAPSYSALSWLETSILFPAKFADISVKATATQDDEKEFIRREKLSIEEMRSILSEMLEAKE